MVGNYPAGGDYGSPHQSAGWFAMTVFIEWRRLFFHLAGAAEVGEIVLPQSFIDEDGHGVAEVEAPRLLSHGQAEAAVIVRLAERLRQTRCFLAEKQPAVRRKTRGGIVLRRLGGGQPEVCFRLRMGGKEGGQALICLLYTSDAADD